MKRDALGAFDVVVFSGVFYHLIDPVGLTRQVGECAAHVFVVETHHDAIGEPRPAMIFYPGAALDRDSTNWWGPNHRCMYELLTEFGFSRILYRDSPASARRVRGIYHAFRDGASKAAMGVGDAASPWLDLGRAEDRDALFAPGNRPRRLRLPSFAR